MFFTNLNSLQLNRQKKCDPLVQQFCKKTIMLDEFIFEKDNKIYELYRQCLYVY